MNWFVLLVFFGLLSASQCNSSERLIFAFATAPQTHFFFLKQQKLLPDVEQVKTSLEHLRVFANHGNFDAKVLIAQQYRDNPIRYQQTLEKLAENSRLGQQKLIQHYAQTKQWQAILASHWEVDESTAVAAKMALKLPLDGIAENVANKYKTPTYSKANCRNKILLITTDLAGFKTVERLKQDFERHYQLPLCLSTPVYFDKTQITCTQNQKVRLQCHITDMQALNSRAFDKLVIFDKAGIANAGGNRVHMRYDQSEKVLLHELMHLFGFIDEYPLRKSLANLLCNVSQTSKIAKNIVVMPLGFKAEEKIQYFGETWFKTNTCDKADGIAYKPVKETTNMELLDLPVPDLYMAWLQQAITD